ncbi:hypothetical protein [Adlercreutzia sp. ZJ141]|uniref:hypothetical protein n=1 Tax=Adlercreutzia sp. ZJ141 TaxID=2709406 RepID=UPI0013EAA9C2|nr:hypothetical protein [Adlercreutzia sp. ZJ141]
MVDWTTRRLQTRTFRRVEWPSMDEAGEIACATGGTLDLSALSEIKGSGNVSFDGDEPRNGGLVRVSYAFVDEYGEHDDRVVATMRAACESPTLLGGRTSGKLELSGMLSILSGRRFAAPYTAPAGSRPTELVANMCAECGLAASITPSAYVLSSDWTSKAGVTWLSVCNELLDKAGFASLRADPYGTIVAAPYVEPMERSPVWEFRDGDGSILVGEVEVKRDLSVPNAVRLCHSTADECLEAWCINVDPDSPSSVPSLGFEVTKYEAVSELAGDSPQERLASLVALAERKLVASSARVEKVKIKSPWVPVWPDDAIAIEYTAAGLSWRGCVTSIRIPLAGSPICTTEARRFVRTAFKTESGGRVICG